MRRQRNEGKRPWTCVGGGGGGMSALKRRHCHNESVQTKLFSELDTIQVQRIKLSSREDASLDRHHQLKSTCCASRTRLGTHAQTRTHSENMAEAAARAAGPAKVSTFIGTRALVDQTAPDLERAVDLLKGYLSEDRLSRMEDVLDQRTRSATLVFENPANPNNVSEAKDMGYFVCYGRVHMRVRPVAGLLELPFW